MIKGRPIDEIKWKGNTPHIDTPDIKTISEAAPPVPLNYELIWLSDFHTGYYHDKINSKMFMKWIITKVIPPASRNNPGVQMVPVTENAPHHHVRGIPSLTSFSKKININLMREHGIDYMILPLINERISLLPDQ